MWSCKVVYAHFNSVLYRIVIKTLLYCSSQVCLFIAINWVRWYYTVFSVNMTSWEMLFQEFPTTETFSCCSYLFFHKWAQCSCNAGFMIANFSIWRLPSERTKENRAYNFSTYGFLLSDLNFSNNLIITMRSLIL